MDDNYLYSHPVIEFLTSATEFCRQLEQSEDIEREAFITVMLQLLPLIYIQAGRIEEVPEMPGYIEQKVTEDDYNYIRFRVHTILGENDDYLDVFVEDFKYSDQAILQTISENLADIYQVLRELVEHFRLEEEEAMAVALYEALDSYKTSWGQTLLNALRALHDTKYGEKQRL